MKLVRRRWLRTAGGGLVVGLAIALTLAVVGRGAFGQSILSVVILLWRLPALLSIAAIAGFIEWQQDKIWATQICRGAIALSLATVVQNLQL